MHILLFLVLIGLAVLFPRGMKYMIAAPVIGFCLGGFAWGIISLIWSPLVSPEGFGGFLLGGILATEALFLFISDKLQSERKVISSDF